jgi:hypothetical protein
VKADQPQKHKGALSKSRRSSGFPAVLEHDPEKACPALGLRGVKRFSEKIMRNQRTKAR